MWQRFTEEARKAIFYAQESCVETGGGMVGPDQVMLGLIKEDSSTISALLVQLGASTSQLSADIKSALESGQPTRQVDMTLSKEGKAIINLAYDSSRSLGHSHIGPEHLLLGIIQEGRSNAAKALKNQQVFEEAVKDAIRGRPAPSLEEQTNYAAAVELARRGLKEKLHSFGNQSESYSDKLKDLRSQVDKTVSDLQQSLLLGLCMELEQGGSILESENWKKLGLTKDQAKSLSEIGVQVHRLLQE